MKTPRSQKACIFDMDGVLIDTERMWKKQGANFLPELVGDDVAKQLGSVIGLNTQVILEKARALGAIIDTDEYYRRYDEKATGIYGAARMTPGLKELGDVPAKHAYKLALVTASRTKWIDLMLPRLPFADALEHIISLSEHLELRHKPHPDGYREAMRLLDVTPENTIIVEDSNSGIAAGKAAEAFVIALRANLVDGYVQTGADMYADTLDDIIAYVEAQGEAS
jgi:HAD superfamily hydrolase (TIGR01509 family)